MITMLEEELQINISDVEPEQRRERLIKAIAAVIRWNATADSKYDDDGTALYTLGQLLEELTMVEG
jgi:hypothetical protein